MKTKSKTFQEGDDIDEAMLQSQQIIWDNNVETVGKPFEEQYYLKHKVQLIVKIFDE